MCAHVTKRSNVTNLDEELASLLEQQILPIDCTAAWIWQTFVKLFNLSIFRCTTSSFAHFVLFGALHYLLSCNFPPLPMHYLILCFTFWTVIIAPLRYLHKCNFSPYALLGPLCYLRKFNICSFAILRPLNYLRNWNICSYALLAPLHYLFTCNIGFSALLKTLCYVLSYFFTLTTSMEFPGSKAISFRFGR